jgi:hypothetical protein
VDPVTAFGLVAGVATLIGLALAVYYGRREGRKRKLFVYQANVSPYPIASSTSLAEYRLGIRYEPRGGQPRDIENAYAHYLRFANVGREPILGTEIAPANHLRIVVADAEVLDTTIEATKRDVSRIALGKIATSADETTIPVTFDFLDYQDGALVRLLTTDRPREVTMAGDVIGMPEGIKTALELRGPRRILGTVGFVLFGLLLLGSLTLTAFTYRWVTGEWDSVWLLALPIVALIAPIAVSLFISDTVWPKETVLFPRELFPAGSHFLAEGGDMAIYETVSSGGKVVVHRFPAPPLPPGERNTRTTPK